MMKKTIFALLAFVLAHFTLPAQSPEWTVFRSPEQVNDFEDMGDFFWLATGNGVSRLQKDGLIAELWTPQNSALPSQHIQSVAVSQNGTAWIGTYDGEIAFSSGGDWETLGLPEEVKAGTPQDRLYFIEFDAQDHLWAGTNSGLHRFDGQGWTTWNQATTGEFIGDVWDFALGPDGKVYFASFAVYELDGDVLTDISQNNPHLVAYSDAYLQMLGDELWYSSPANSLARYHNGAWEIFPLSDPGYWEGSMPNEMRNIVHSAEGEVVVNTNQGLFQLSGGVWSPLFSAQSQQAGNDIDKYHVDGEGASWAFFDTNVSRMKNGGLTQGVIADLTIGHNTVRKVVEHPDGSLFIQSGQHKVDRYQDGEWTTFWTPADTFAQFPSILEMKADANGNIWICTYNGLFKWDGQSWEKDETLPFSQAHRIETGSGGQLWVTFHKDLAWFDGQTWKVYTPGNSPLTGNIFKDMIASHDDVLWITTYERELFRLEHGQWQLFTKANSIIPDDYWSGAMTIDAQNRLWISLGFNGLLSIKGSEWTIIPAEDIPYEGGFPEAFIYSVTIGPDARFYLARYQSLTIWDGAGEWVQYSSGNSPLDAYVSGIHFDSQGRVWIATHNGLLMRQTEMVSSDHNPQANRAFTVRIFPNPADNLLFVEWAEKTTDGATLLVLDAAGRTVRTLAPPAGSQVFQADVSGLRSGLYYLQYIDGRQREAVKWVKR